MYYLLSYVITFIYFRYLYYYSKWYFNTIYVLLQVWLSGTFHDTEYLSKCT